MSSPDCAERKDCLLPAAARLDVSLPVPFMYMDIGAPLAGLKKKKQLFENGKETAELQTPGCPPLALARRDCGRFGAVWGAYAAASSKSVSVSRKRRVASPWIWHTRLSVTPSTVPISFKFKFSM